MSNQKHKIADHQHTAKFSLIRKIIISIFVIFCLYFIFIGIYIKRTIKTQIIESSIPPIDQSFTHVCEDIDVFFENVEKLGIRSVRFVKNQLNQEINETDLQTFDRKYRVLNGALRTNLTAFKSSDITGVFLSSKTKLSPEIKKMIIQTEQGFRDYAFGILHMVFNMYFISKDNLIRIYKKDWALEIESDHLFKDDIFYRIATPDQNPERTGQWTHPYYDSIWKHWMTSHIAPIYLEDDFVGVIGHDIILDKVYEKILRTKFYKTGYIFLFDKENNIVVSPEYLSELNKSAKMGTKLSVTAINDSELSRIIRNVTAGKNNSGIYRDSFVKELDQKFLFIAKKLNFLNWYLAAVIPESETLELLPKLSYRFILSNSGALFLLLISIVSIVFFFIIRPIKRLTTISREIHQGNLNLNSGIRSNDEIGELSYSFDKMTSKLEQTMDSLRRDLQIRKETEKALYHSNEKFKKVFENSPYTISLSRKSDKKYINLNLNFETLTGYLRDEAIKSSTLDLQLWVNPEQRAQMEKILSEKGFVRDFNFFLRRKDNQIRNCMISSEVIDLNEEQYIVSIISDITDQENARKERRILEEKLEQSKKMEALGTLAGGVAHDLNNILSGLVSYPDLLLMKIDKESPMRRPLNTIKESGKKAAAIVQDLLTLARRGVSTTNVVNLNELIGEYLASLEFKKLQSFHPNVIIKKQLKSNLFNIVGSKVHLVKTIMNLVSNASESMPKGGEISIATRNQYLDKRIKRYETIEEGNYAILEVQDRGIGISPMDLERIFEPFYTKKKMGKSGTGLGMAVVWGTVKDHKGYLDVQSIEDQGTTFTLYFPVTNKEITRNSSEFDINEYLGNGENILVVDDVLEQRELAYDILTRIGYSVSFVESGEKAIAHVNNTHVDLLLLDMVMEPGIDGLDTFREIIKVKPHQKAIIVSGFSETDRVNEAIRLGVSKYIKKPYSVELLAKTVKSVLGK